MALSIKAPEADRLARELSAATGETLTEAVLTALRERLVRVRGKAGRCGFAAEIDELVQQAVSLRRHVHGTSTHFLYDDDGLPR